MSGTSIASLAAIISFSVLLLTTDLTKMIFFGLFWISILALLIVIMTKKRWTSSEWLGFAAFSASMVVGVLLAAGNIHDVTGVGVVLLGLLFVTMIVNAIRPPRRKKRKAPQPRVAISGNGKKYHRRDCRLVKGKNDVELIPKELAQSRGLKQCGICKA